MACCTLSDLLHSQSNVQLLGPRDTLRDANRFSLPSDGVRWMLMIQALSPTAHTPNRATAEAIARNIRPVAIQGLFSSLRDRPLEPQQRK